MSRAGAEGQSQATVRKETEKSDRVTVDWESAAPIGGKESGSR